MEIGAAYAARRHGEQHFARPWLDEVLRFDANVLLAV
jgi:hypothetical protein